MDEIQEQNIAQPLSNEQSRFSRFWTKIGGRELKLKDKIILSVMVIIALFVFYIVLDANKYLALVRIVEGKGKVGVNPTSAALDFGDLSRGSGMARRVKIENGTMIPMYIMAFKIGSVADLIKIDKNFFRLAPRSDARIEFTMYVPASAEVEKTYRGRVFLFKIPTFGI